MSGEKREIMLAKKGIIAILTAIFILVVSVGFIRAQEAAKIYFFYGTGCSHCSLVEEYFEKNRIYERYEIDGREIYFNRENAELYNQLMSSLGIPQQQRGVPAVVFGETVLVGDKSIIEGFIAEADRFLSQSRSPEVGSGSGERPTPETDLTLALVLAASFVDAINPCAFAVLVILMSTVLATGQAKMALKAGLAFAGSIFISYFLMGLGLYQALRVTGGVAGLVKIAGGLAIILGLLNLKDWCWYGKGFLMEVPQSWRPRLRELIGSVTSVPGAFLIGFLVSLFLLPCTSGPYIVILGMLAEKAFRFKALIYLVLYNLVFVSPMVLISWLVYRGLSPVKIERLRQRRLRTLHLIAGLVLIAMGVVILKGWI